VTLIEVDVPIRYAGFWIRLSAFILDVIPIFVVVFCAAYFLLGFDQSLYNYMSGDKSQEARILFLSERNKVRDAGLFLWIFYGLVMDCSRYQGTHGKFLLKLKVVDELGGRIDLGQSIKRTSMKILGALPIYLGYVWAVFRKDKAAWHDLVAKTRVMVRE